MTPLAALWLPILLSAVFVFVVSSIIHMAPLWHRTDYPAPPDQDRIMDALRPFAIPPGDYMVPRAADMKAMSTPEFTAKMERGPVVMLTVLPNGPGSMGRSLGLWFVYALVVGLFAAYIAGRALPPGVEYLSAFRMAGASAFLGYALALAQMSIWYRRSWSLTIKAMLDGFIYALVVGGTFGWLWP